MISTFALSACGSNSGDSKDTEAKTTAAEANAEDSEGKEDTDAASEGVTITFAHGQGEWMYPMFEELADNYYELTGNKIEYITIASDEMDTWITAQFAAGTEPDIIYSASLSQNSTGSDYFNQGKILDLTPYYNEKSQFSDGLWKDAFMDGMLDGCVDNTGEYYIAGTISRSAVSLYYNIDLMEELGLGTTPPSNLSELMEMCETILEDGRYVPFSVMNSMAWNLGWLPGDYINELYEESGIFEQLNIINPDNDYLDMSEILLSLKSGLIDYEDQRIIDYFAAMKDFTKYFNEDFNAASWEYESLFNEGKAVFNLNGGWFPSQTIELELDDLNYGTANIPYFDDSLSEYGWDTPVKIKAGGGEAALWVSQKCADEGKADAAIGFLQYLTDKDDGAQIFLDTTLLMPVVADLVYPEALESLVSVGSELEEIVSRKFENIFAFNDEANQVFWEMYTMYLDISSTKTAEEFAKGVKDTLMPLLEEEVVERPEYNIESYLEKLN